MKQKESHCPHQIHIPARRGSNENSVSIKILGLVLIQLPLQRPFPSIPCCSAYPSPGLPFWPISARSWDRPRRYQFCSQRPQSLPGRRRRAKVTEGGLPVGAPSHNRVNMRLSTELDLWRRTLAIAPVIWMEEPYFKEKKAKLSFSWTRGETHENMWAALCNLLWNSHCHSP